MRSEVDRSIGSSYKWAMLAVAWIVYFAFGMVLASIPPLVTPIARDLGLTNSEMGVILGTMLLAYIPLAIPVGFLVDRVGARRSIMTGAILVSLSGFLRSFATSFETLFLSVFIFGLGGPIISVGVPKIVASWFRGKDRGAATGIYITGPFVGNATALAITNTVVMPLVGSWQNTFRVYGVLGFLIALVWLLFGRDMKRAQPEGTAVAQLREAIAKLLREKYVWLVAVIAFPLFFAGYGYGNWLPKMLELNGMSPAEAGFLASLPGWFGLIGAVVVPRLGKAGSRKPIVFITILVQGICMLATGIALGLPLIASLVFYGIASSATPPLLIVILMDMPWVGAEHMGAATGIVFSVGSVAGFLGPYLVGFLMDLTGSLLSGIIAMTVLVEAALFFTLLMKEK